MELTPRPGGRGSEVDLRDLGGLGQILRRLLCSQQLKAQRRGGMWWSCAVCTSRVSPWLFPLEPGALAEGGGKLETSLLGAGRPGPAAMFPGRRRAAPPGPCAPAGAGRGGGEAQPARLSPELGVRMEEAGGGGGRRREEEEEEGGGRLVCGLSAAAGDKPPCVKAAWHECLGRTKRRGARGGRPPRRPAAPRRQ